jgi:putative ABC transport system permease protein
MGTVRDRRIEGAAAGMKFGQRLRSRFWRARVEDEVDAEFSFHVEMRARELIEQGMPPADAREAAIRRFGDINRVNATCRAIGRQRDHDMRRTEYFSELTQDVSFACRQLFASPGFTVVSVLTLALGIGATTAIFSAVQSVVLRPLPFPQPDRLLSVYEYVRNNRGNVSAGNFVDGIEPVGAFSAVAAEQFSSFNVSDAGDTERVIGGRVTAGYFDVFNLPAVHGRVFTKEEDQPGREQVVVLSHRLWTRRFGSDPGAVGRRITLNEQPYDIIGVMPAAFDYTADGEELWVPIAFTAERKAMHDEHYLQIYGRLKPEATESQALGELHANAARLRVAFPRENAELDFTVTSALDDLVGDYPRRMFTLLAAVGFVLLISCGNVANLLLARGAARAGELAVRSALGAGRARIVRQLLTESVVLALVAAIVGIGLAAWGIRVLVAAAPPGVPRLEQTTLDPYVLSFTLAVTLVSAMIFGVAPALRAARVDVQTVIKAGGRAAGMGGVRDRLRTGLIAAELAVALLLLVGAGLLIRSSLALQDVNPGFDPSGVLSSRFALPAAAYPDRTSVVQTLNRLAEATAQIPGATASGITTQVPMGGGGNGNGLIPEGVAFESRNAIGSRLRMVTPGYFATMRIPIVKGRPFTSADRQGALKVMVISEALARAAFPDKDPIGKRIACCEPGPDGKSPDFKVVVGVAGDVRSRALGVAPSPEFYLPIDQVPAEGWDWVQRTAFIAVRTDLDPLSFMNPVRDVVRTVAPGVPVFQVRTMEQRLRDSMATARFNTMLLTLLGLVGLVLAAIGVYGVIAYFVTRRTQEIGVRMALGASRGHVFALVLRQAAWALGLGIAAGVGVSAAATRVLTTQLFGVSAYDPVTFAVVVITLTLVALVASLIPARRAASVDPTRALHMN